MKFRRTIVLLVISASIGLCSCGNSDCKSVELADDISFHADISQNDNIYSADFERAGSAGWKAVFTSPETIEGMEIALFNDTCTVSFKGLTYTSDRDEFPEQGMVTLITSAIDGCISGKVKCHKNGSTITEAGDVNGIDFEVKIKDEKPIKLKTADIIVDMK